MEEDPRIQLFRQKAAAMGYPEEVINSYISARIQKQAEATQQKNIEDQMTQIALEKQTLELDKAKKEVGQPTEAEKKTKSAAGVVDTLEELYFGKNPTKDTPLAFAKPGVEGSRLQGTLKKLGTKIVPGKPGSAEERMVVFQRTLESKRALLAKAAGDSGNLALQEQILAGKALPDFNSTPTEAVELFKSLRSTLQLEPTTLSQQIEKRYTPSKDTTVKKNPLETAGVLPTSTIQPQPMQPQIPTQQNQMGLTEQQQSPEYMGTGMTREEFLNQPLGQRTKLAFQNLVGSPEAREKFMSDYKSNISGEGLKESTGIDLQQIPVLKQILQFNKGLGGSLGKAPIKTLGGITEGKPIDALLGALETALSVSGAKSIGPIMAALGLTSGAALNKIKGESLSEGAGEGLGEILPIEGGSKILGKVLSKAGSKIIPTKVRLSAAEDATKKGVEIGSKSLQKVSKDMIKNKITGYGDEVVIKKLAQGKPISPKEALDLMVRAGKRTFTKGGDFRLAKQADYYTILREGLREEFSKKVPEIITQTTRSAKVIGAKKLGKRLIGPAATGLSLAAFYKLLGGMGVPTPSGGSEIGE